MTQKNSFVIVNIDLPLFLTLSPGPEELSFDTKKVYSKTQTLGGWVFEHRGSEPDMMSVSGRTPAIIDIPDYVGGFILTTREIRVETYLTQLQQLVKLDKERVLNFAKSWKNAFAKKAADVVNLSAIDKARKQKKSLLLSDSLDVMTLARTLIYYKGVIYFGFFDSFTYKETSERFYTYNFKFVVVQSTTDYVMGQLLRVDGTLRTFLTTLLPATIGSVRAQSF